MSGRRADPVEFADGTCWSGRRRAGAATAFGAAASVDVPIELPTGSRRARRVGVGGVPLRGPARRVPAQDRRRRHPARRDRAAGHRQQRTATSRSSGSPAPRRGQDRLRQGAPRRGRRHGRDQELQRRHAGSARSAATLRVNAANGDIAVDARAGRGRRPRPPTATSGSARSCAASVELETALGELEVGIREGTAAWLDVSSEHRPRAQRARRRPTARRSRRDRRGPRPHLATATSSSAAPDHRDRRPRRGRP